MKFVHLSDLHLGKRVNEFSMLEDQKYILLEILRIIDQEQPDGILIAGDIYDKPMPSAEAVALLDDFLVNLSKRDLQIFVISGNHDSPERIAYGGRLMKRSGVHLAPVYNGTINPIQLSDEYGPLNVYLLPFIKPVHIRHFFPDRESSSYTESLSTVIDAMGVDCSVRNVLVAHQFVTGASRCDSEEISVGGADNVDSSVFDSFDYVALGHLHGPQQVAREVVRYSGTPLKYSFSEVEHQKSLTVVELKDKGNVTIHTVPLTPMRDMVELRGAYDELTLKKFYEGTNYCESYVHITLTDEDDIPEVMRKLQTIYPYLMKLDYDNRRTRANGWIDNSESTQQQTPLELLDKFYEQQNGQSMGDSQKEFAKALMEEIWEGKA